MKSIDEIASDVDIFVQLSSKLEMICKHIKIPLEASPLYNFRDALSHYIKRYEATTDEEKIRQEASIDEHLFRGIKDICVFIIIEMKRRVSNALGKAGDRVKEHDCRKLLHKYKKMEIEIRKGTEAAINRDLDSFIQNLCDLVKETKDVFDKYQFPFCANANYMIV